MDAPDDVLEGPTGEEEQMPLPANPFTDRVRNVAILGGRVEMDRMRQRCWSALADEQSAEPITGRPATPDLVLLGRYLRRARRYMSVSQESLARGTRVSQSMISRAERAIAPAMGLDPLTRLGRVLGRSFPLGCCPHDHDCAWQPIVPRVRQPGDAERLIRFLLTGSHDPPDQATPGPLSASHLDD